MKDKRLITRILPASVLFCLLIAACERYDIKGMFFGSSPSADERFAESNAYNAVHGFKTIKVPTDNYYFYVCTDAHLDGPGQGLSSFVDACAADSDSAPFALFVGDAVNGEDYYDCFFETVAPIEDSGKTLFYTPGNHDIYFGQWSRISSEIGSASYTFEVITPTDGTDLYVSIDSSSGTLGTDQRAWLGDVLSKAKGNYRNIIVFTHTHFFKKDNSQGHSGNFKLEEGYDLAKLFKDSRVSLVLSGHDHSFEETIFKDVRFLTLACIHDTEDPVYYTLEIGSSSARYSCLAADSRRDLLEL